MPTKIKHVAIVSSNPRLSEFYTTLFGMRGDLRNRGAASISDGYIGMNVNPRGPGRQGGFDHFGFEVDDIDAVRARIADDYPQIELLKRPDGRSFTAFSTHDPAGNVFDLSPASKEGRKSVYLDLARDGQHNRRISHLFLRTVDPDGVARFYQDVFELKAQEKPADDPSYYLTDGTVTLVVAPWRISSYAGSGIERPALDHLGFEVENLAAFQADLQQLIEANPALAPMQVKNRAEGDVRMRLLATCRYGTYHLSDPDGVLLDVSEAPSAARR
jgi:catechol 2,3-dioxygenase-like lactoylglutathione lyase family enzyme